MEFYAESIAIFKEKGRIVSQSLNPGGAIPKGKTIYLKLKE